MKRILAAVDHSEPSLRAAQLAADVAEKFGAELVLLTVAQQPDAADGVLEDYRRTEHIADTIGVVIAEGARVELEALRARLAAERKQTISFDVLIGSPAETIGSYAKRAAVDLIVMGHVGHGKIGALLIGSVAKTVVDTAACPVLIVH